MTGFPITVFRDGDWKTVDVDELTEKEWVWLQAVTGDMNRGGRVNQSKVGWMIARHLAKWIRDNIETEGNHVRLRRQPSEGLQPVEHQGSEGPQVL